MPKPFYKPKKEKIGPEAGYKDDGGDVKYQPKRRIKKIYYLLFIIGFLLLVYLVLR